MACLCQTTEQLDVYFLFYDIGPASEIFLALVKSASLAVKFVNFILVITI